MGAIFQAFGKPLGDQTHNLPVSWWTLCANKTTEVVVACKMSELGIFKRASV